VAGTTIILTVLFSVVAIPLLVTLAALALLLLKERTKQRRVEADTTRANPETLQVRRETLADDIAPRGRSAQAKADVKAAQAAGKWPLGTIRTSVGSERGLTRRA
jgi:hypothetical protein